MRRGPAQGTGGKGAWRSLEPANGAGERPSRPASGCPASSQLWPPATGRPCAGRVTQRTVVSGDGCGRDVVTVFERRSEEHTSELQSLAYLVCRLLLEKKKKE